MNGCKVYRAFLSDIEKFLFYYEINADHYLRNLFALTTASEKTFILVSVNGKANFQYRVSI